MNKTLSLTLITLLLALTYLAGCSLLSSEPLPDLRGTVSDAYTGEPLAEITLALESGATATTDAQGKYTFADWKRNDTLDISAPGYETQRIALADDPQIEDVVSDSFPYTIILRPNTLSGIVTNEYTGAPVHNAVVTVSQRTAPTSDVAASPDSVPAAATTPFSTTTDIDGAYTLTGVPGYIALTIRAEEFQPFTVEISQTTRHNVELQPAFIRGTVTNYLSNQPVAGIIVEADGVQVTTADDGSYTLHGITSDVPVVTVRNNDFAPSSTEVAYTSTLDIVLHPTTLTAQLLNRDTREPIAFATIIATPSLTETAVAMERIDNSLDGTITLTDVPQEGYIQVLAPGYRKAVFPLQPGAIPQEIEMEPFFVKSLYIKSSTAAYMPEVLDEFFDVIDETELNAIVIDLKSDNIADLGLIYYQSDVPIIKELGTSANLLDIRAVLAEARARNIYTIARIHVFSHDNLLAETKPEWAAQDKTGCTPNENRQCNGDVFYADWDIAWLDSWNRKVWDYNIQLGVEAAQLGFDEIQFDYIRFASDARNIEDMELSKPTDPVNNPEAMYENIAQFMEQAHKAFNEVGAFFSVDVFGYAAWQPQPSIGQNMTLMAPNADYICPMVYPSHYMVNELGFENAAAHPYEIVYESLKRGQTMVDGSYATLRPWLQDFTLLWMPDDLIVEYGVDEVRAQIEATEVFTQSTGWALWNSDNEYTFEALEPDE